MSDSEDELTLSTDALAALQEFRQEESQRLEQFNKLYETADANFRAAKDIELFKEDWQLSQFWYDNKTATLLAEELLEGADEDTVIVIISAPSVYAAMTRLPSDKLPKSQFKNIYLFEYDTRFRALAGKDNFVHYDFNKPLEKLPQQLLHRSHRVLIDPPFLSDDCQVKAAVTVRALLIPQEERSEKTSQGVDKYRFISCTGERMQTLIHKVYPGVQTTNFFPSHERGLSNEFRCYASYEGNSWKFLN